MSELTFESGGDIIADPLEVIVSVTGTITVTNYSDEIQTGLGVYIVPSYTLGELDYPSDFPPETDYQDLLTWGQDTTDLVTVSGGIYLELTQEGGAFAGYVNREQGADFATKIPIKNLAPLESTDIDVTFELPPATASRRFYVDLVCE